MHYTTGQIVRSHPETDGSFSIFKITGFVLDLLEVETVGHKVTTQAVIHPDSVELFEFTCNTGSYIIGDKVRAMGHEGTWVVHHFADSRLHSELLVAIENPETTAFMLVSAHYVKKVA